MKKRNYEIIAPHAIACASGTGPWSAVSQAARTIATSDTATIKRDERSKFYVISSCHSFV
jgi:hypothetical protein